MSLSTMLIIQQHPPFSMGSVSLGNQRYSGSGGYSGSQADHLGVELGSVRDRGRGRIRHVHSSAQIPVG